MKFHKKNGSTLSNISSKGNYYAYEDYRRYTFKCQKVISKNESIKLAKTGIYVNDVSFKFDYRQDPNRRLYMHDEDKLYLHLHCIRCDSSAEKNHKCKGKKFEMKNIPIELCQILRSIQNRDRICSNVCKQSEVKVSHSSNLLSNLGIEEGSPVNRCLNYGSYEKRLDSFIKNGWSNINLNQDPKDMAEAGFVFEYQDNDEVWCFYCQRTIYKWDSKCDPWYEHAKHVPYCRYVCTIKSPDFVKQVQQETTCGTFIVHEYELDKLMELSIIQHAILYFKPHFVRKVLKKRIEKKAEPFFSVQKCINAVKETIKENSQDEEIIKKNVKETTIGLKESDMSNVVVVVASESDIGSSEKETNDDLKETNIESKEDEITLAQKRENNSFFNGNNNTKKFKDNDTVLIDDDDDDDVVKCKDCLQDKIDLLFFPCRHWGCGNCTLPIHCLDCNIEITAYTKPFDNTIVINTF
uniref:Baculoviral IAP repeat-containing protein n=1 Tax=Metapenaeus ensis majanivirus TaxID=2984279 RepID=A0A9C7F0H3_9VIRU|nr:MAG: baculoviral IAP repeat-containing protein [Metapenaeus ensis majanivirus]